jgi:hypothetical protein
LSDAIVVNSGFLKLPKTNQSMNRVLLFLCCLLSGILLFSADLRAQSVVVADTSVERGKIFPVDIRVNDLPAGGAVSITIRHTRNLLYYQRAEGGGDRIMQCATPDVAVTENGNQGTLVIRCSSVSSVRSGVLVTLYFESLAGSENTTYVEPQSLQVDGQDIANVAYDEGRVTIAGEPVIPQPADGISPSYPNPFNIYTTFDYTVTDDPDPEFMVYTLIGRLVPTTEYKIERKANNSIIFTPEFDMANGPYLMQMKTKNGVFQVPFFFIR